MAQITALQFYGVPGRTRTFSAKAVALIVVTTAIHIFSDSGIEPAHATDNRSSVLIKDGLEVRENIWVGDATDYLAMLNGVVTLAGSAKRILTLRPEINLDEIKKQEVPDQVQVGVVFGYSMPVWEADSHEELFFRENVPGRWDGVSDIIFHILVALASAQPAATRYFKYALDWNQVGDDDVVPLAVHNVVVEQTVPASTAQYTTYELTFTIDYNVDGGDPVIMHDLLAGRLRRIAATTGTEITGEVIVLDWHSHYQVNKMFKAP